MRKVIKIFFSVFSWLILAAIIIPLCLALMLYLPSVQTFAVRQATDIISEKTGADISIDKVHLRFFNRLALYGVYVGDLQKDTLLYVGRLSVGMSVPELFGDDLSLGKVKLEEAKFYLHQQPDSMSNLKHLLHAVRSERNREKGRGFKMHVKALEIENLSFKHTKYVREPREYGVNFTDIDTKLRYLNVDRIDVADDSVSMRINDISLRDKSGFDVKRFSSRKFSVAPGGLRFSDLEFANGRFPE